MNMLSDGTCFIEDFMKPQDRLSAIDRVVYDLQKREKRLQEMANELIQAGWSVEAPKGRV